MRPSGRGTKFGSPTVTVEMLIPFWRLTVSVNAFAADASVAKRATVDNCIVAVFEFRSEGESKID